LLKAGSIIGLRRSERGHPYGFAIPRMLEQHAEITIRDLAKNKLSRLLPQSSVGVATRAPMTSGRQWRLKQ
jgi:hypothetical protein